MRTVYNNALAETMFIIKCLPKEEQEKIPIDFMEFINDNKNNNYKVKINPSKNLQNQKLLEETKEILKHIYLSYFISEDERKKILQYDKDIEMIEEDIKNKNFNYDELFKNAPSKKNNNKEKNDNVNEEKNLTVIEKKLSLFRRLLNLIKNFFNKKNKT